MDFNDPKSEVVVLVGGGFAGLTTALSLSRRKNRSKIILIEPRPRFVFLPLLFELLSGEVTLWEIAPTYKSLVEEKGIVLIQEHVTSIDTVEQKVLTDSGLEVNYTKVVICSGSKPDDFGIPGVLEHALTFHNFRDVQLLKELINELKDLKERFPNVVVVGAGPTGVELACKLSDLLKGKAQIHLVELESKVLPNGKAFNQEQSERALNKRGIKVHLQTKVTSITANNVQLERIQTTSSDFFHLSYIGLIWTAGSRAVIPEIIPRSSLKQKRISIDAYLNVIGYENVLAIGDVAFNKDVPYPVSAQVAMQQGKLAARNLIASSQGSNLEVFKFNDFGEMISLGIGKASITAFGITLAGSIAFQARRIAYLTKTPHFSLKIRSATAWLLSHSKKCK
tara:strand:- start:7716 stop:8900 length:1185 start_codon:yes stop_codon:yes gene_type:complete